MAGQLENEFLKDPKSWISFGAILVAAWASYNSWRSRRIANKALAISERQEERRNPRLVLQLSNSYRRRFETKQVFAFLISVSNTSDINNSIALAELRIKYRVSDELTATCRISHVASLATTANGLGTSNSNIFVPPIRIDAHQTVSGWVLFPLANAVFAGKILDSHQIVLTDTHGLSTEIEVLNITEWKSESTG